jgi:hypothetical protein
VQLTKKSLYPFLSTHIPNWTTNFSKLFHYSALWFSFSIADFLENISTNLSRHFPRPPYLRKDLSRWWWIEEFDGVFAKAWTFDHAQYLSLEPLHFFLAGWILTSTLLSRLSTAFVRVESKFFKIREKTQISLVSFVFIHAPLKL